MEDDVARKAEVTIEDIVHSENIIIKNFRNDIIHSVNQSIFEREDKRIKNNISIIGIIVVAFSVAGYKLIEFTVEDSVKKTYFNNEKIILDKMSNQITYEIDKHFQYGGVRDIARDIHERADYFDKESSFSTKEKNEAMALLRKYNKMDGEVSESFLTDLGKIIESFHSSVNNVLVDEIVELFGKNIANSGGIAQSLTENYGFRYVISLSEYGIDFDQSKELQKKFYSMVPFISEKHRSPELALPFLVIEYHILGKDVRSFIATNIATLNTNDKMRFIEYIFKFNNYNYWATKETPRTKSLQNIYSAFFGQYGGDIKAAIGEETKQSLREKLLKNKDKYKDAGLKKRSEDLLRWLEG